MLNLSDLPDALLVALYSEWSERNWCAGFMAPHDDVVASFVRDLRCTAERALPVEDYEREMLTKARALLDREAAPDEGGERSDG